MFRAFLSYFPGPTLRRHGLVACFLSAAVTLAGYGPARAEIPFGDDAGVVAMDDLEANGIANIEEGREEQLGVRPADPGGDTFLIRKFKVVDAAIFSEKRLNTLLEDFTGFGRTAEDVQKARDALEQFYHEEGYPTVLVNIPEQSVEGGTVILQVIESKVGNVVVTGNRYYTREKILERIPTFSPGAVIYLPDVQTEINRLNGNPDLKVIPSLAPSREIGTVDVELKVEDNLPFHGSLELNNRSSHDTSPLRLSGMLRYDNLWQQDHSVSLQYQTAPQKLSEVQAISGAYVMPLPWDASHRLALYGVVTDSETAFGEGFNTVGNGMIIGGRYVLPLADMAAYRHTVTLGVDYKDFEEVLSISSSEQITTPVTYMPFSLLYNGSFADSLGVTQFTAGLNLSFRGLVADKQEFEDKRFKGRANYLYLTAGIERMQQLPYGMGLFVKVDGQLADQPLISNEQYSAGGTDSVRGYKESESLGDNALHTSLEWSAPDLAPLLRQEGRVQLIPYLFNDFAMLTVKDPLPGSDRSMVLHGIGFGMRGTFLKNLSYQFDWAWALRDSDRIAAGDYRFHFLTKYEF
jgi:hemolysin activation/secretion protein